MGRAIVPFMREDFDRLAEEARWHEAQATTNLVAALEHYAEAGQRLRLARKGLRRREWGEWVGREFPWTLRYAQYLMEWARLVEGKANCSSLFPPGTGLHAAIRFFKEKGASLSRATLPAEAPEFGLPRDDYRIVLADPPWQYDSWNAKGTGRVADDHYPTMTIEEIAALPVAGICHEDAVLLLWVTMPLLREGLDVVKEWGFTYRTAFLVWGKLNGDRSPAVGFGKYTRSNGELCLLGRRGKGVPVQDGVAISNLLLSQRGAHSAKPPEQYRIIEHMFGREVPKVELFARGHMPRWDVWGLEAPPQVTALDLLPAEVAG
jgi:N6-adenosine-specific RNA methylase IME4